MRSGDRGGPAFNMGDWEMVNDDQEWFYKSPEWEALVEAFDKWDSRVTTYRGSGEDLQPFVRKPGSEFDGIVGIDETTGEIQTSGKVDEFVYADTIAEQLAILLHSVAKIDPMPIWDAYLAVERYELAVWQGDDALPEPPWNALRRAEILYDVVWVESRTRERPNPTATAFTGDSGRAQRRRQQGSDGHNLAEVMRGRSKSEVADVCMLLEVQRNKMAESWTIDEWKRFLGDIAGRTTISETITYKGLKLLWHDNKLKLTPSKRRKKKPRREGDA